MPLVEIIREPREVKLVSMGQPDKILTPKSSDSDEWYYPPGATEPVRRESPAPLAPASDPTPAIEPSELPPDEPTAALSDSEPEAQAEPQVKSELTDLVFESEPRKRKTRKG